MSDKPIPKSLHTVTVLVKTTKAYHATGQYPGQTWEQVLGYVLLDLGLSKASDPHNLRAAALKQLEG